MAIFFKTPIKSAGFTIALPVSVLAFSLMATSPAYATISCAGYLPNSYFERIDDNRKFAGKLVELEDGTQQLEDSNGNVVLDGLTDSYILMDKYLWAQQLGTNGKKYGIVTATGEIIVPFSYDNIATEPDIATSFIVSLDMDNADGLTQQGIIDRNGYWIYPIALNNKSQQPQRRIDNGYGNYSHAQKTLESIKAVDKPLNLTAATIRHAHYDSDNDRDYFLIESLSGKTDNVGTLATQSMINKIGLLDDQGSWVIPQQYDALQPLNPCTGQPLYLQATLITDKTQQTALLDQQHTIIIPFAANQHIESFNNNVTPLLFLRSTLIDGSTAAGMSEDIRDEIVSAQIIDENGRLLLSSTAPITKLLYHQLYAYQQAGKFGFIDGQGKIVLKPQFESYRDDADKVFVEKNGKMVGLETLIDLE
jgi:hypothetical protein